MKILWLSHLIPYPPKGGVLQRSYNLLKEISKNHDLTLMAFNQSGFLKSSLPNVESPELFAEAELKKICGRVYFFEIPENRIPLGRELVALKALISGSAYNMQWLKCDKVRSKIKRVVENQNFDLVHIDTISLCVYKDLFVGIPVVLNHHNFESEMLFARAQNQKNIIKRTYFNLEARRLRESEVLYCKGSDLNIVCSDGDRDLMRSIVGAGNFITVPNGVDVDYFYPNEEVEVIKNSILLVGGMSWYPNREAVEYFLKEIWPLIKVEIPGMTVDIVGRSPSDEIKKLVDQEDSVFLQGFVDDVREYLWRCNFYLCPIRTGGGTKLKILDALASGCCIIADPFSCLGIEVDNNSNVLFASEPEDYVKLLKQLIEDPRKVNELRLSAPKLIREKYSYSSIGSSYSEQLVNLAGRN